MRFMISNGEMDILAGALVRGQLDAGGAEHHLGSDDRGGIGIFIAVVNNFRNTALDNGLGTLVAGEESDIDFAAL